MLHHQLPIPPRRPPTTWPLFAAVLALALTPWLATLWASGELVRSERDLWASITVSLLAVAFGMWVLVLMRRERETARRHLAELEALTLTDALTGLGNRRALERELARAMLRSRRLGNPLTLLFMDVDQLKLVNDRFGHAAGDDLLRKVAAVIRSCSREGVDSGFRVGGDEFVVIALTDLAGSEVMATRAAESFRARSPFGSTLSIGGVEWDGAMSAGELLSQADRLMYRDKHMGHGKPSDVRSRRTP